VRLDHLLSKEHVQRPSGSVLFTDSLRGDIKLPVVLTCSGQTALMGGTLTLWPGEKPGSQYVTSG
jgi:hypothetical protein